MKMTVGELRQAFQQALDEAGKVSAHPDYMKKERVRETLQGMIVKAVREGDVSNQKDLDAFVATLVMATTALKSIPFEVYKRISYDKH
jgi:hypothetical protein